ncbi:MAG: purine-nucleoside phosphorylase, partial [Bradymonadaceae bacterium]
GSGLGALADEIEDAESFDYDRIPHFPVSAVEGHAGELVFGTLEGKRVAAMSGRVHYYEGWSLDQVTFPVRAFGQMGADQLLVTNSAGGANPDFSPGDLMLITDHINITGVNPLRGDNDPRFGPRFPDMSDAYTERLREVAEATAEELEIDLRQGVYTGVAGPSYETPAEINMIQTIGGDAVGMSTVPEVIVANHMDLDVLGISCITNMAAGLQETLDHDEVKEVAARVRSKFTTLVRQTLSRLPGG